MHILLISILNNDWYLYLLLSLNPQILEPYYKFTNEIAI